tara:strand:- start:271 stop:885 length:615 start_codon:yes stop_codon:yes gene_type:complete
MNNKIPIFPLSNVIFFPETDLPLNIFEKRYIQMVDMSLKNEKLIGIVQPKTEADLYSIGCLGKITSFTETEDKRYIINLRGISKFKIIEEIENEYLFREFKVEYLDKEIEKNYQEKLKTNLINSEFDINQLKKFLRKRGFSLNWKQVDNMDFKNIVNALCMIMPITVNEKQTLLETENITERFEILKNIIDLDLLDKFKNRTIQ